MSIDHGRGYLQLFRGVVVLHVALRNFLLLTRIFRHFLISHCSPDSSSGGKRPPFRHALTPPPSLCMRRRRHRPMKNHPFPLYLFTYPPLPFFLSFCRYYQCDLWVATPIHPVGGVGVRSTQEKGSTPRRTTSSGVGSPPFRYA